MAHVLGLLRQNLTLGLLLVPLLLPVLIIAGVWSHNHPGHHVSFAFSIALYVIFFFVDVFATFVSPALAFSTRRVWIAIPTGFRMLVRTWPQSFWYAVAPPITLFVIGADFIRRSAGIASALVVTVVVGPLIGLLAKSATALYYVRLVPDVGDQGSAFFSLRTCRNGHPLEEKARFCPLCGVDVDAKIYPR